ncbi:unnamed protein product [Caenorhabditis bovis]|uniref:Uncharacterized protein n=1 Tax=Caenorhabditis bovis TaxID=2654633 RepID=A0A8S1EL59_9PELO|nr:unnamed protein product [Caenorhabditis bovis]
MDTNLDVSNCLLDECSSAGSHRKLSALSATSSLHAPSESSMSRKKSIRERMADLENRRNPKKPTPPSIFEAAQLIGKFSGQRIDLLSARNSVVSHSSNGSVKVETRLAGNDSRMSSFQQEGAMLPSSSSKDDDLLSTSSDEVENMATRTLQHMEESASIITANSEDSVKKPENPDVEKGSTEEDAEKGR